MVRQSAPYFENHMALIWNTQGWDAGILSVLLLEQSCLIISSLLLEKMIGLDLCLL